MINDTGNIWKDETLEKFSWNNKKIKDSSWNNTPPINAWVPEMTKHGKIYLKKEEGDDKSSLLRFLSNNKEIAKLFLKDTDYSSDKTSPIIMLNDTNHFSEGTDWYYNVYENTTSNDPLILFKNGRCHSIALCGTRGQSLIDFDVNTTLPHIDYTIRDYIVKEQYSPIESCGDGTFDFENEGKFGESILTFSGHTATYFGTSNDGTQYFISKNNSLDYSIETYQQLIQRWGGTNLNAYTIKQEYKDFKLTEDYIQKVERLAKKH